MKRAKTHNFSNFTEILLILLIYMYLSLLLKMINGFSRPEKIMASPFNFAWVQIDPPCAQTGVKSSFHTYVLIPKWRLHKESMIVCLKKKSF